MTTEVINPIATAHGDYQPTMVDFESSKLLFTHKMNDVTASVHLGADDSGYLYWTDNVANVWIEHYPTLHEAMMRLAVLQACAECDWQMGFTHTPKGFVRTTDEFVNRALAG